MIVRLLQCKDIQVEEADSWHRMTPFATAIANGHLEAACDLLATGQVNLNTRDKNRHTPVYHAIRSHNQEAVTLLLLKKELDVDVQDHLAVRSVNLEIVRLLLSHNLLDVNKDT